MLKPMKRWLNQFWRSCTCVSLMIVAGVWPAIAMAQQAAPQPKLDKAPPVWLGLLVMVLLLAVVMAVSLMPSKRSHQD